MYIVFFLFVFSLVNFQADSNLASVMAKINPAVAKACFNYLIADHGC